MGDNKMNRRTLLATGTGGALGGMLAPAALAGGGEGADGLPNVYELLGVQPILNAAGTITALGGSLMPPEVVAAWNAAAKQFVPLAELQDRVGDRIARLLGVEAALVTTGAAGGMQLATAAAVTWRDKSLIGQLPLPPETGIEVIRQKTHHACYDHQVTACGVKLVDVETLDELERAVSPRTAMMLAYNIQEKSGRIGHREWIAAARRHGIPTLLDAAADTPPRERLWEYNKMGFDLVAFSGGKALRGPQNAGLLLGRKDLIEAAKLNTSPNCGTIGRGLKVSKEDMVAMWAAVERFMRLDLDAEEREWRRRIETIAAAVRDVPTVKAETIVPPVANHVPHLLLHWDEVRLKITPERMKAKLAAGNPPIATARVHGTGETGFLISVFMLQPGEDQIVAARVREILEEAQT
ncbi:MAG: aminotransferase class V-fold PLP-dependent enzyme [Deltaproteobacteria bacterium]